MCCELLQFPNECEHVWRDGPTLVESCSPPEAHSAVLAHLPSLGRRKPPSICIHRDLSYIYLQLGSWRSEADLGLIHVEVI